MREKLLPCPNCGSVCLSLTTTARNDEYGYSRIRCRKCHLSTDFWDHPLDQSIDEIRPPLLQIWNRLCRDLVKVVRCRDCVHYGIHKSNVINRDTGICVNCRWFLFNQPDNFKLREELGL